MINQYKELEKENIDYAKLQKGDIISNQLKAIYSYNGRFPESLEGDETIQISQKFWQDLWDSSGNQINKKYNIGLDEFYYQSLDNGKSFKLCIKLSAGQKCWEQQQGQIPEICPGPYHTTNANGFCGWSCSVGTTPSTSGECECQTGYSETGKDSFGRRVCEIIEK